MLSIKIKEKGILLENSKKKGTNLVARSYPIWHLVNKYILGRGQKGELISVITTVFFWLQGKPGEKC